MLARAYMAIIAEVAIASGAFYILFPELAALSYDCILRTLKLENCSTNRCFFRKFPRIRNRELILKNREIFADIRESNYAIRVSVQKVGGGNCAEKRRLKAPAP